MYDVTRVRCYPSERQPSVGFRCEGGIGDNDLGMYQKEHPTGSLRQIMLGWPGGRVAGWPGGRVAGWPGGRVAGWPGHEIVCSPGRVLALPSGLSA